MTSKTLVAVSGILSDFSPEASSQKLLLIKKLSKEKLSFSELKAWHDKLLFLSAYADNSEILAAAQDELDRISDLTRNNEKLKEKLLNRGIAYSLTQSTFTFSLTKWLIKKFPGTVSLHSFDEGAQHPKEILKYFLPAEEFEILADDKLNAHKWLQKVSGTKDKSKQIEWLVDLFDNSALSLGLKEHLFESMKVYVEIAPTEKIFSRTFGQLNVKTLFYHKEPLLKKFDERELIERDLPRETKLSKEKKDQIISSARVALALLQRETDPVTYSEEGNLRYFELERGLSIALFSIDKAQRLPLESYIGFMMFKNGYPMSYGGAWLFEKRALIGINIFEAYRGGESAFVFAQLLRCYHKAFDVDYFEVEPYQFGKNNPEGIKSGAFWFYHRFGFRPVRNDLRELANSEFGNIISQKGYRTSFDTLKKFTLANLALNLKNADVPINPSDLSRFVTEKINHDFKGSRIAAKNQMIKILKREKLFSIVTKEGIERLGMIVAFCLDLSKMNAKEKGVLLQIITAKVEDEFEYIKLLNRFRFSDYLNEETGDFIGGLRQAQSDTTGSV